MRYNPLAAVYECDQCGHQEVVLAGDQPSDKCPVCGYIDPKDRKPSITVTEEVDDMEDGK